PPLYRNLVQHLEYNKKYFTNTCNIDDFVYMVINKKFVGDSVYQTIKPYIGDIDERIITIRKNELSSPGKSASVISLLINVLIKDGPQNAFRNMIRNAIRGNYKFIDFYQEKLLQREGGSTDTRFEVANTLPPNKSINVCINEIQKLKDANIETIKRAHGSKMVPYIIGDYMYSSYPYIPT
ncbi:unnamed protein product, partial [marine sediment metagenome]